MLNLCLFSLTMKKLAIVTGYTLKVRDQIF